MESPNIAIIYCTRFGHTEAQSLAVRHGVEQVAGARPEVFSTDSALKKLEIIDGCSAIIFGCPTYMGSLASSMKGFMESAVGKWSSRAWSGKIAGGFTNSCNFSGDKLSTLFSLVVFSMQLGMIWVGVDDLPPNSPTGVGPDEKAVNRNGASIGPMACTFSLKGEHPLNPGDVQCAENYGRRVANFALNRKIIS